MVVIITGPWQLFVFRIHFYYHCTMGYDDILLDKTLLPYKEGLFFLELLPDKCTVSFLILFVLPVLITIMAYKNLNPSVVKL